VTVTGLLVAVTAFTAWKTGRTYGPAGAAAAVIGLSWAWGSGLWVAMLELTIWAGRRSRFPTQTEQRRNEKKAVAQFVRQHVQSVRRDTRV
jgi:membrane protein implicated in regulation of membrane protease activity